MIGSGFEFRGFDAVAWDRLLSLLRGALHTSLGPTLIVTVDGQGTSIGAFHTSTGRVDAIDQLEDLAQLCEDHETERCVVLEEGVLTEIAERASLRVDPDDDYVGQWLTVIRAARELRGEGRIRLWPDGLSSWPLPSPQILQVGENFLLPNGHAMVLAVFEGPALWTAAVVRRQHDLIDLLAGPDELKQWVGPLGGDWRRDFRVICAAVEQHVAPVHLGVFTEADTARRLLSDKTPGRWAAAVTTREVVVQPVPAWLSLALGADGLVGMASTWTQRLMGLDADQARDYLQAVVRGFTDDQGLPNLLEWEPVRLIMQAISTRPGAPDPDPSDDEQDEDSADTTP